MSKRPRGSIHKVREFELEKIQLVDEFDILQIVGEGWFGKILLVEHRASHTEMVLKAVPKPYVSLRDFYREFHYGLHLGIHRNIVTTYDVAFETAGFYVFTQEYAPLGDLTSNVTDTGVGEVYSKRVAKQIASALDYMHSKDIVHRDVKLDNVLIYRSDFSRVKLCDFGESYQNGTLVERRNEWLPYSPPEVLEIKPENTYKADPTHDIWQFGIVVFVCLTGCLPWQKAASDDPRYVRYVLWQSTMMLAMRRTPKLFKLLTSKAQRMFKRFLEPRWDRRPKNLSDLMKFMDDRWLAKTAEKEMAEYETDELCPSMYSFHSSPDEKNRLLYNLADCGIETNVDRQTKKDRIKEWIESSIITEEEEEENDNETNSASSPSSSISREPVRGHISSLRPTALSTSKSTAPNEGNNLKLKEIKTTLKDASRKHFDPRTGALQQGPSEMGATTILTQNSQSPSQSVSPSFSVASDLHTINDNNSLAGSLVTLGSRNDFLNSSLDIYQANTTDLHQLGEHEVDVEANEAETIAEGDLEKLRLRNNKSNALAISNRNIIKNTIGVGTNNTPMYANNNNGGGARKKSILQRSKSDSVKFALSASQPALNSNNYNFNASWLTPILRPPPPPPIVNHNINKTVTFTDLTNTWDGQSNHAINCPTNPSHSNSTNQSTQTAIMQKVQQQYCINNSFYDDTAVKDTTYLNGLRKLLQQREEQQTTNNDNSNNDNSSNNNNNNNNNEYTRKYQKTQQQQQLQQHHQQQQYRQQQSHYTQQQQQDDNLCKSSTANTIGMAKMNSTRDHINSMKDTAYDRFTKNNNTRNRL